MSSQLSPPNTDGHQVSSSDESKVSEQLSQNEYKALKSQLEQIFADFDKENRGRIVSRDLFSMIEKFERNQTSSLLKDDTRPMFQMFCEQNPDMEVSVDDVLQLITKLQPSAPSNNTTVGSTASSEPMTPRRSVTKFGSVRSNWRNRHVGNRDGSMGIPQETDGEDSGSASGRSRRLSSSGFYESPSGMMTSSYTKPYYDPSEEIVESFEGSGGIDEAVSNLIKTNNNDDPAVQLSRLYRHTVDLTKRLKESERHLASVARQHEDRIEELQHKLDETKADLATKKREIQDHKSKEKTNLHQISALEGEIQKVAKNLSSQKQLYSQLKRQYEEQCEEAEKLKDLVRIKEEELSNSERNLTFFSMERRAWTEDRERLESALRNLEKNAEAAQQHENELVRQRDENLYLKETIDKLKLDLEEIRSSRGININKNEFDVANEVENIDKKSLRTELFDNALASIEEGGSDSNTDDTQRRRKDNSSDINAGEEQSHSRSGELDRHRGADTDHTNRKQSGSRSSRRQVTDASGIARNTSGMLRNRDIAPGAHDKRDRQIRNNVNNVDGDSTDLMRHSRLRQSTRKSKRKATPVPEIEPQSSEKIEQAAMQPSKALVTRNQNMTVAQHNVINSTVTLALYTLVIYFFGIITSVFVLDNNQGNIPYSEWLPNDLRDEGWTMRSVQIILYWIDTLLNDGEMRIPTFHIIPPPSLLLILTNFLSIWRTNTN
ncbi:annexin family protein [Rhizophagus clarus]|uniref:Annexin family protein n=1 Tax=Rhizophagus clarus TaxID=94130 RepID=A0A8H3LX15_9GLOM|nr:annexin family protein [Rhizophagus clarus]